MTSQKPPSLAKQAVAVFRRKGFTLIELLVVMSIVLILGALLFPGFQGMVSRARGAACTSNLRQISSAIALYMADHNNTYPAVNADGSGNQGWSGYWFSPNETNGGLVSYVGDRATLLKISVCPENHNATNPTPCAYSGNYNVMVARLTNQVVVRATKITRPSQIMMLADSSIGPTWGAGFNSTSSGWPAVTNRHGTNLNVLWVDGHVSAVTRSSLSNTNIVP